MSPVPLLAVRDLAVRRGRDAVVAGISFEVAPGEILAITGPNGGGKTSLVRAVLGEIEFTGMIRIASRGPAGARIGYVPQVFDFDRTLPVTVSDFLALPLQTFPSWLRLARSCAIRIEEVLGRVDLPGHADRSLGDLSGGELQRVLFAQALLAAPDLLLLDEPTQGMDAPSRARFEAEVLRMADAEGIGVLLVSHDPEQMRRVARRVAVLDRTLVALGGAGEVLGAAA